jgi:mercuric ion binding protein
MCKIRRLLFVSIFLNGWAAVALAAPLQTIILDVKNMTCEVCPITVKKALQKVPGVRNVTVDFDKKTARLIYDPDEATPETLIKATTDAGYPSVVEKE